MLSSKNHPHRFDLELGISDVGRHEDQMLNVGGRNGCGAGERIGLQLVAWDEG